MHTIGPTEYLTGYSTRSTTSWRDLARQVLHLVSLWRERARQRQALAGLDDSQLRDIGITRYDAEHESNKPFWR
jgi:uncharacterized protein YjiS (DUF1127 family)